MNRMTSTGWSTGMLALIALGATACERDAERSRVNERVTATPDEMQGERAQPVRGTTPPSVQSIMEARCAREQRCNNIGPDREYASLQACMTRVEADWSNELSARECPGGVNQSELNECLQEIRNDDCNNPIDTLGRFAACRESDLCDAIP